MDDRRSAADRLGSIEGADEGALGTKPTPEPAPTDAQEQVDERTVPGATYGERSPDESKPWFTSVAAESDQAGVANDPPDAQGPEATLDPDDSRR
jgi:hypothetical protein